MTPAVGRFQSILSADGHALDESEAPAFFRDLNLDQLVAAVVHGRDEYALAPLFYHPLDTIDDVGYRHEVFRDLDSMAPPQPLGRQINLGRPRLASVA